MHVSCYSSHFELYIFKKERKLDIYKLVFIFNFFFFSAYCRKSGILVRDTYKLPSETEQMKAFLSGQYVFFPSSLLKLCLSLSVCIVVMWLCFVCVCACVCVIRFRVD